MNEPKQQKVLNMILTSLVNNDAILKEVVDDVECRFKTKMDIDKVRSFLIVVEPEVKDEPLFV